MYEPLIRAALAAADACRFLGVSERKFHDLRRTPGFPQPLELGPRCLRWRVADLQDWLQSRPTVGARPEPARIRDARDARRAAGDAS